VRRSAVWDRHSKFDQDKDFDAQGANKEGTAQIEGAVKDG
jgi:hypothetical protein